jgi:hypothetical protein
MSKQTNKNKRNVGNHQKCFCSASTKKTAEVVPGELTVAEERKAQ